VKNKIDYGLHSIQDPIGENRSSQLYLAFCSSVICIVANALLVEVTVLRTLVSQRQYLPLPPLVVILQLM
jgi:hypothetical protein